MTELLYIYLAHVWLASWRRKPFLTLRRGNDTFAAHKHFRVPMGYRPKLRGRHLLVFDVVLLATATLLSFTIGWERLPRTTGEITTVLSFMALATAVKVTAYLIFGLYRRLWSYASIAEVEHILIGGLAGATAGVLLGGVLFPLTAMSSTRIPLGILILDGGFSMAVVATPRLIARLLYAHSMRRRRTDDKRVVVVGAGAVGQMTVKELLNNPKLGMYPLGFVDDDRTKRGRKLANLPVFGALDDIEDVVRLNNAQIVLIAMPTAPGEIVRRVVEAARRAGVPTRTVPNMTELLSGRLSVTKVRDVEIQDLLRREPVQTDMAAVRNLARGRTVMVTGAGGSIGSELARQLAQLAPARLVLLGHGENSIFDVQEELIGRHPNLAITPVIADVRDATRIRSVFDELRPYAVFHAAAHKHVPLMEQNVVESITNNVQGTTNVVNAAVGSGVEHLVLISTDKAVRPTSIMGATKRLAERIVQHAAITHGRNFVSVRFGNVLGSRGSVIPTFLRQIRDGGPVTVTHPDMRRYFMTIPEAVQLVLQAGALGNGGEVFVLDMGEPVRIVDLATDLIRLCGVDEREVRIEFTGMRPGEKLYEEMFFHEENATPTDHPKVLRARKASLPDGLMRRIERLVQATATTADEELRGMLVALVPDFQDATHAANDTGIVDLPTLRRARVGPSDALLPLADSARPESHPEV